tara:strand:- start:989 stop:1213 length:225 start_codon:yes stop_codon:yes gene_type:complete
METPFNSPAMCSVFADAVRCQVLELEVEGSIKADLVGRSIKSFRMALSKIGFQEQKKFKSVVGLDNDLYIMRIK